MVLTMGSTLEVEDMLMQFGKYKGQDIRDVPLTYLQWWKGQLIESLRVFGEEIRRREQMGLTPDIELQLGVLDEHVRANLLLRLEQCKDEDERADALWLIKVKYGEYSKGDAFADRLRDTAERCRVYRGHEADADDSDDL